MVYTRKNWRQWKDWQRVLAGWAALGHYGLSVHTLAHICRKRSAKRLLTEMAKHPNVRGFWCSTVRGPMFTFQCSTDGFSPNGRGRASNIRKARSLLERFPYPRFISVQASKGHAKFDRWNDSVQGRVKYLRGLCKSSSEAPYAVGRLW